MYGPPSSHRLPNPRRVTHIIFDLDGILLDSHEHYRKAYADTVDHYGRSFSPGKEDVSCYYILLSSQYYIKFLFSVQYSSSSLPCRT